MYLLNTDRNCVSKLEGMKENNDSNTQQTLWLANEDYLQCFTGFARRIEHGFNKDGFKDAKAIYEGGLKYGRP